MKRHVRPWWPVLSAIVLFPFAASAAADAVDPAAVLRQTPIGRGLCVHLGCGRADSPALTAELAASGDWLVHGLALDDAALARARAALRERGVADRAQVERLTGPALPYVDTLADAVVIGDADGLAAAGIGPDEIDRALAPGGIRIDRAAAGWAASPPKPRPSGAGAWTHPMGGPGANRVSTDAIRFPLGLRWQDGVPLNIVHWASERSYVAAGGRVFSVGMTEPENVRDTLDGRLSQQQWLTARNAANGLVLWKVALKTEDPKADLNVQNLLPLATDGARVVARRGVGLASFDAATGRPEHEFAVAYPPERMVLLDGTVVAAGWKERGVHAMWDEDGRKPEGAPLWGVRHPEAAEGSVEAFAADSGASLWRETVAVQALLADAGRVAYLIQAGAPVDAQELVARELRTGRELWRQRHTAYADAPDLVLLGMGRGLVVLGRHKTGSKGWNTVCRRVIAVSADDGSERWAADGSGGPYCMFVGDAVWYGANRYDPAKGGVLGPAPAALAPSMCAPPLLMGDALGSGRGGVWTDVSASAAGAAEAKAHAGGIRASCVQGAAVADGRVYVAQNYCRCAPAHLPGFIALGSQPDPDDGEFASARPVETDAGAPRPVAATATGSEEWPTFRYDAARSAACPHAVATNLAVRWTAMLAPPAQHALAVAWRGGLRPALTAPVAGGGQVFVGVCEEGAVVALDAADGRVRWRAGTGSRLDSPPTVRDGLCFVGSHDGWLYAFAAADGRLAWRARAAPRERRMVSFGKVESSWPVIGSPIVSEGVVYAVAGRSTEMEGGTAAVAFDGRTGKTRWAARWSSAKGRRTDVLSWRDDGLWMQGFRADPATGRLLEADPSKGVRNAGSLDGLLDGTWTRLGNRRSGGHAVGQVKADALAWEGDTTYGYSTDAKMRGCFAIASEAAGAADPRKPAEAAYSWRREIPRERQVEAMAVARDVVLAAGRAWARGDSPAAGFLLLLARADGRVLADIPLPAPGIHQGIAVRPGAVVVALEDGSVVSLAD